MTHVTDVEVEEAEVASVAEAAMMIVAPEAIPQAPEPITDWLSKIYLPEHLGRLVYHTNFKYYALNLNKPFFFLFRI